MYRVSREIDFCYGHRLLDYVGKCRHLHGHNGKLIVTLESDDLDNRGMVLDFGDIKQSLSAWIDQTLDHRMILHKDDPAAPVLRELGEPLYLIDRNPTAENLARMIYEQGILLGLPIVEVRLWETPRCYATYCPTAGNA
jgi:6-pyruvoyltetrahydropterin/6-carboxytetrahydropterin synthase